MSHTRRPALLEEWAELTRAVRPPPIQTRTSSRVSPPIGALLVISVLIAVAAWQGLNPKGPGNAGSPTVSFGPDAGRADWWISPADLPLQPTARQIRGFLMESACASGQSPEGRVLGPSIEYGVDEVIVTFKVREIGGDCPSNPRYPITIALQEPIGSRTVIDGGVRRDAAIDPTIVVEPPVRPPSSQLPSSSGTCSASQFVLGLTTNAFGFGTLGTTSVFVTQPLRNAGADCVMDLPTGILVASATGYFMPVAVVNAGIATSLKVRAGQSLSVVLGAWWRAPATSSGIPWTAAPCANAIREVTRAEIPLATGSLQVDLGTVWLEVCSAPASVSISVKT